MYDPNEVIEATRSDLRLLEAVFRKGYDPCLNGIWDLCERKIDAAETAGNPRRSARWRKVRLLERRCGQNIAAQVDIDGVRFCLRFEVEGERRWLAYDPPSTRVAVPSP